MKQLIKPSWLNLNETKLADMLVRREYPVELVSKVLQAVRAAKAERKASRTRNTVIRKMWADVLKPARTERDIIRVMKAQTKQDMPDGMASTETQARYDALCAYETVLENVIELMHKESKGREGAPPLTPQQLAKANHDIDPTRLPRRDGTHWTYYVKRSDMVRILQLFDAMPHPARGKKKIPFEHRISREAHQRQRSALIKQINRALEDAEQELDMATNPQERLRLTSLINDIHRANYKIELYRQTDPLPETWQGLL